MNFALLTDALSNFEQDCAGLASRLKIANTTVYFTQYVPAGATFRTPGANVTCSESFRNPVVGVDLCRLSAYTATSERSGINFETWLPRNWTGRFISHGNGDVSGQYRIWIVRIGH
jgi:feruloyl esterase